MTRPLVRTLGSLASGVEALTSYSATVGCLGISIGVVVGGLGFGPYVFVEISYPPALETETRFGLGLIALGGLIVAASVGYFWVGKPIAWLLRRYRHNNS